MGFEPTEARTSRLFESRTIDHSDISPQRHTLVMKYAPGENRTPDALLRTEALYPLSYEGRTHR